MLFSSPGTNAVINMLNMKILNYVVFFSATFYHLGIHMHISPIGSNQVFFLRDVF